jgi:hypothetical protein
LIAYNSPRCIPKPKNNLMPVWSANFSFSISCSMEQIWNFARRRFTLVFSMSLHFLGDKKSTKNRFPRNNEWQNNDPNDEKNCHAFWIRLIVHHRWQSCKNEPRKFVNELKKQNQTHFFRIKKPKNGQNKDSKP